MVKEIKLTNNKVAIVSDEDYDLVSKFNWYCNNCGYARNYRLQLSMHEYIFINLPNSYFSDNFVTNAPLDKLRIIHINKNKLDNTRNNLKLVTSSCVSRLMSHKKTAISKYKGVSYHKKSKKWAAHITVNKKLIHLMYSNSEIACAKAYDKAALKYFGKCSNINFPELITTEYNIT